MRVDGGRAGEGCMVRLSGSENALCTLIYVKVFTECNKASLRLLDNLIKIKVNLINWKSHCRVGLSPLPQFQR